MSDDAHQDDAWLAAIGADDRRRLELAIEAARRAEERSRRFLADAAHQLRGPITAVQAGAEQLLADPGQPQRERVLANIIRETARAGRLLAQLLRLARLDHGEMPRPEPCDVVGIASDEADRTYHLAPHLDLVVRAEPIDDPTPVLDGGSVREILANLLDNARRYAVSRIEVGLEVTGGELRVRVTDDGPGLPAYQAERAFERFVTLDPEGGSGLGLAIARDLARAHSGELHYADGVFVLRLPADQGPQG